MSEQHSNWASRRVVSANAASLAILGLRAAGYTIAEWQVSDQPVDLVAQACVPDDPVRREAIQTYLALLLLVVEHPDHWAIEPAQLPEQIERHGESWYRASLESAQRTAVAREEADQLERQFGPPIAMLRVEGHFVKSNDLPSMQDRANLRIEGDVAAEIADTLLGLGYHLGPEQIEGKAVIEVVNLCEPDDLVKQRMILLLISNRIRHRRSLEFDWDRAR